ncbi:hypothetical protein COLO4_38331 [Corchorus olitorius]|uniref:Reverse transcriptase zinc-binding domain-containing protein n=1 Tax=Corchorus olitorius TaxID=93759 RepID=A0A1R3FVH3_9ROSI|nr:hypothetical protein COLO4_38331 [Corchorus olitorius]
MVVEGSYVVCDNCDESVELVFFSCPLAARVWSYAAPWIEVYQADWRNLDDFWYRLMERAASLGQFDLVLVTLWSLWTNRNKCLHSATCCSPISLCIAADKLVQDTQAIEAMEERAKGGSRAGLGVVLCDGEGSILASASRRLSFISSAFHGDDKKIEGGMGRCLFDL